MTIVSLVSTILVVVASILATVCAALLAPIIYNLYALPTHFAEHTSSHPASPYTAPRYDLSPNDIDAFRRDGLLVLRDVMPANLVEKLVVAGDDLMDTPVRHCEMTKFTSPPIFHGYERYCGRASLVHDYLRDVALTSPLTHVAAQLIGVGKDEPLRSLADVFMAGIDLPRRWHSDYLAFQKASKTRDGVGCRDGLVFWMPLEKSYETKSGMLFLNGTSRMFEDEFAHESSEARSLIPFRKWIRSLDKTEYYAPELELGDAIVFDQCTVHATSGINTEGLLRRAFQLRFLRNAIDYVRDSEDTGIIPGPPQHPRPGVTMPQVWPTTLEEEDAIRAAGPIIFSRSDWTQRMTKSPVFALFTSSMALKTRLFGDAGELNNEPERAFDDVVRNFLYRRQGERLSL